MEDIIKCPYCGFNSHPVCQISGPRWRCCCERCRKFFVYNIDTGEKG